MANEEKKDFNAMLHRANGMPKVQLVTDEATVLVGMDGELGNVRFFDV